MSHYDLLRECVQVIRKSKRGSKKKREAQERAGHILMILMEHEEPKNLTDGLGFMTLKEIEDVQKANATYLVTSTTYNRRIQ